MCESKGITAVAVAAFLLIAAGLVFQIMNLLG